MRDKLIILDASKVLKRRYSIRKAVPHSRSVEITLPWEVVAREAEARGLTIDEFVVQYEVECLFDDFSGVHYRFVKKRS